MILHGITLLGYAPVYVALGLVLVFAVRTRAALATLLALLLADVRPATSCRPSSLRLPIDPRDRPTPCRL